MLAYHKVVMPKNMHYETCGKRPKVGCTGRSRSLWVTMCYWRENITPSCAIDSLAVVDDMTVVNGMTFVLTIEAIGSLELVVIMRVVVLLEDCSPLLLFMGVTILIMYLLVGYLTSFLVILPLLNLMNTHKFKKFLKWWTFQINIYFSKTKKL